MRNFLFIFVFIVGATPQSMAQKMHLDAISSIDEFVQLASQDEWNIYKTKEGVRLKYRWLKLKNTPKTRQITLSFQSQKNVSDLLKLIKDPKLAADWNESVRMQKNFEVIDSAWVSHTVFEIPYPLSQQDLVVKNRLTKEGDTTIIKMYSIPNFVSELADSKRQQFYLARWLLNPISEEETSVEFSLISLSKSNIPRFIRDPLVLNKLINSFIALKYWKTNIQ